MTNYQPQHSSQTRCSYPYSSGSHTGVLRGQASARGLVPVCKPNFSKSTASASGFPPQVQELSFSFTRLGSRLHLEHLTQAHPSTSLQWKIREGFPEASGRRKNSGAGARGRSLPRPQAALRGSPEPQLFQSDTQGQPIIINCRQGAGAGSIFQAWGKIDPKAAPPPALGVGEFTATPP